MTTNFDMTFEKNKVSFKQKFGIEWNSNISAYLCYLQTLYISSLAEITNTGLGQILSNQKEMEEKIKVLTSKIAK
ncbi:MAG: hypothetical protein WC833_13910 [Bacteroidales bacterium]|jgi:hypothetical protein